MALADLTKQLAEQAIRSATAPATPPAENAGAVMLAQIQAMQKALKDDEELVVLYHAGAETVRIFELFFPSWQAVVLTGATKDHGATRVVAAVDCLQLTCRVIKAPPQTKPHRIGFVTPKSKAG